MVLELLAHESKIIDICVGLDPDLMNGIGILDTWKKFMNITEFRLRYEYQGVGTDSIKLWPGNRGWSITGRSLTIIFNEKNEFEVIALFLNAFTLKEQERNSIIASSIANKYEEYESDNKINIYTLSRQLLSLGYENKSIINMLDIDERLGEYYLLMDNETMYITKSLESINKKASR